MTDILDLIDNAVRDYETGPDAMRWSPDPPSGNAGPLIEAMRSMVNPEALAGRSGIVTTIEADASPTVTYSWNSPDGILSYTDSPGFTVYDEATGFSAAAPGWAERIEGLQDTSITVTGYYLDTSSLGAFLDEAIWEATGRAAALSVARTVLERVRRRLRLRALHSAYSARLRARRRRNRR